MNAYATRCLGALTLVVAIGAGRLQLHAQSNSPAEAKRQVKHLVTPQFPDLAKKLNLTGTVRIEVTIGPDGIVKRTRVAGGHPVLAAEAERAAQKSTFEPGPRETMETIEFKF
jgi:TonB family protein